MKKYILIMTDKKHEGDQREKEFDTLEEANKQAEFLWGYLTDSEKRKSHYYVVSVEKNTKYFDKWMLEDPEEFTWSGFHSADQTAEMWDSDNAPIYDLYKNGLSYDSADDDFCEHFESPKPFSEADRTTSNPYFAELFAAIRHSKDFEDRVYFFKTEEEARAYAQESGATPLYVTVRREDGAVCGAMKMEAIGDAE